MAHSLITFSDRSCLMPDADVLLVAHITRDVASRFQLTHEPTANVRALLDGWQTLLDSYGAGAIDLGFDAHIRNQDDRAALIDVFDAAQKFVRSSGPALSGTYLNGLLNAPGILSFTNDYPVNLVLHAFESIKGLIVNGTREPS
jgi:hypothetical protein